MKQKYHKILIFASKIKTDMLTTETSSKITDPKMI